MIGMLSARGVLRPAARRAAHLVERNAMLYRRTWIVLASGFLEPLLYLLGIGFGVGSLVGSVVIQNGQHYRYAVFVAPALMATSAMNGAIYETSFNFFHNLKYIKLYDGMLATPLGVADVALGVVAWAVIRGSIYALGFLVIMAVLGLVTSPLAVLALPASLLIGFSFAAVGTAASTYVRSWQDFTIVLSVFIPLFLFSGTFYPITLYPPWLQLVVQLTPLYHGVDLSRSLTTGSIGPWLLLDIVYLIVLSLTSLLLATARLERLLLK